MPSDEQVEKVAESYAPAAEHDYTAICLLCGGVEAELNTRDHEQVKRAVLRVVAAMAAKGVQAGDLGWSNGRTRFVPWEGRSPGGVLQRISDNWRMGKWRAVGRCPDPGEIVWLFKPQR